MQAAFARGKAAVSEIRATGLQSGLAGGERFHLPDGAAEFFQRKADCGRRTTERQAGRAERTAPYPITCGAWRAAGLPNWRRIAAEISCIFTGLEM